MGPHSTFWRSQRKANKGEKRMNLLLEECANSKKWKECIKEMENKTGPILVSGLVDVSKSVLVAACQAKTNRPICLVTYNEIQARKILQDLQALQSGVYFFPKKEIVAYDYVAENIDGAFERMEVLNKIQDGKIKILVTTIEALMQETICKQDLYQNQLFFKIGTNQKLEELKEQLVRMGYTRADLVETRGEFSVRGGIVDIATDENSGVRIEFWGDEVDSIRIFQIASQRSTQMLENVRIYPSYEYLIPDSVEEVIARIREKYVENEEDIELIQSGKYLSKVDKYFNCFYERKATLLDYLTEDWDIILDEVDKITQRAQNIQTENKNLIENLVEKEKFVPEAIENIASFEVSLLEDSRVKMYLENQELVSKTRRTSKRFESKEREITFFKKEIEILLKDLANAVAENKKILVFGGKENSCKKISQLLQENDISYVYQKDLAKSLKSGVVMLTEGGLSSGFEDYDQNLLCISIGEIFTDPKKRKKVSSAFKSGEKVVFADLKVGDYIVHKTHGIGIFAGIHTITTDKVTKDYIKIRYKNDDMLYIPTESLDSIRKYIGGDGAPRVNRLGSKEWENTKTKVKKNLQEVARDLIELYAKRQKVKGFAFSADTPWQKQFEDSFEYVETDDQLRCIEETKKDMEQPRPMDRLLCGDVGFGKTEVAIRAAFKAVVDQKQVAYLVPTTVLANQQYESFKSRMQDYPINIDFLNRFKTKKEQEEVIRKLKLGELDIVIGTHRLLSEDVQFKDLGLLIIDEEHRFGVKDKEKIKKLKTNVDVLTMTATPIPRTLHMSVVGVRDMSVIYEPPQNRKPVQTYVLEYDEEIVREAITKELEREGQVFYLYNKVETIQRKAEQIQELVPEAKVAFAHGKMSGRELEEMMMQFIKGDINVLVCTTILESGIDIPNANTIIVEDADRLGLAQLYQIRGRVGRKDKQAYAYITYKRDKLLSEEADKRLKAIREFTEFGSGFKIAMRDLEIRGAGSLLGEIQHGHLEQVGYETYCKLLDEVVKEMQGVEVEEEQEIQLDIPISSYIPDEYIENGSQKIEIYQDIALCRTEEDLQNIMDELIDRYGTMPKEVENLMEIARIKNGCMEASVVKIAQRGGNATFYFDAKKFNMDLVDELVQTYQNRIRFSPGKEPYITLKLQAKTEKEIAKELQDFLRGFRKEREGKSINECHY